MSPPAATKNPVPVIMVEGLEKSFGEFKALDGLAFSVNAGDALVVLGENGAGKTTTLRCLAGVLKPSAGVVNVGGVDSADDPEGVRQQVGLLSELPGVYDRMTAPDYLRFFGRAHDMGEAEMDRRIPFLLEMFSLSDRGDTWLGNYSKGMRQKVALIRAVLHQPKAVLLDEPTSSMDPAGARLTWDYIHELKGLGLAVVVCTHNLREAGKVADKLAIMARGRILRTGSLVELQKALGLKPRFTKTLVPGLEDVYVKTMTEAGLAPAAIASEE